MGFNMKALFARWFSSDRLDRIGRIEHKIDRLERFSEGSRATYIGNNRVLVKAIIGETTLNMLVEADDLLLSPNFIVTGRYDPDLTEFFLRTVKPDSHCLDVGSNFGFFTCLFCRKAPNGRVVAVEADHHIFELCRDNLGINGFIVENGTALHAAVSDSNEDVTLYRRLGRSGNTSICAADRSFTDLLGEPPVEAFTVPGIRVDDLLDRFDGRLDFIKVDVEGAEPLVLRGAERTVATNPQLSIVMEWSPGQIRSAGFDLGDFVRDMVAQGLTFHDIRPIRPRAMTADELLASDFMTGVLIKR